jgi:DNA invertase Pin-like site-specific DNA recombinase
MDIGYARCSTDEQDLTAQRDALLRLGVPEARIYTDHGMTGRNRDRPGLRLALAAVRVGDTLVVPKLDRLGRSIRDLRDVADELASQGVSLSIGGQVHDPTSAQGGLLFNALAMVAEFESDIIRERTREGMAVARSRGRLKGRQPKLRAPQRTLLRTLHAAGDTTIGELAETFAVSRTTVYRTLEREGKSSA